MILRDNRLCSSYRVFDAGAPQIIAMPQSRLPPAQTAIYPACAAKSNASAQAIRAASKALPATRALPVPRHLRPTGYPGAKILGSDEAYL